MKTYRIIIRPETAFATPIVGDTLFGQMCWAIVELFGEPRLENCLKGYLNNDPFMVVSNAFVKDHLLLPSVPSFYWQNDQGIDRKVLKGKRWIAETDFQACESSDWQQKAKSDSEIAHNILSDQEKNLKIEAPKLMMNATQMHNTLNRATSSTGSGQFAPFESGLTWLNQDQAWQVFILVREDALTEIELIQVVEHIELMGYGRDASTGLGKFTVELVEESVLPKGKGIHNAYMTLSNCCPQGHGFVAERSFYLTNTRFGRHGNVMATSGAPFKKPILMAEAGAVFAPDNYEERLFVGQGITKISVDDKTVHQGYAPVIGINIDFDRLMINEG